MKALYFDIETTGVMHWKNGIHQVSGAVEIDGAIKERFDYKCQPNPKAIIDDEALKVSNVVKDQILAYAPMKTVQNAFVKMLDKYVSKFDKKDKFFLIGYNNASFDNQFLRAWFTQCADDEKSAKWGNYFGSYFWSNSIDVMVLAAEKLKHVRHEMEDFKLKTVAKQMGITIDETKLHDASYDIQLTIDIYKLLTN